MDYLEQFPKPVNDTGRGVHGPPGPQPLKLWADWPYWKEQLQALHIKWLKLLDPGDGSSLPLAEKLVEIGIFPVIRFYREHPNPGRITSRETDTAIRYVRAGVFYFETNNEPDLDSEWKNGRRPADWLSIVVNNFIAEADMIRAAGGYLLFPAFGPGGRGNPFQMIVDKGRKDLLDGNCALAIHNYCLARPLTYPNDPVTMNGQPITKEEWEATAPDKKKGGPMWAWEMGWEAVNEYRRKLANPNANIMDDSTCFRAFEYFDALVNQAVGHSIPIFTTEGGYNVGQRGGTTAGDDPRWPKPSPRRTGELTLEMFKAVEQAPAYYFACMPWLLACKSAGYWQPHFEQQGPWFSWDFQFDWTGCDKGELPVVQMLRDYPGQPRGLICPPDSTAETGDGPVIELPREESPMRRPGEWVTNGHPGDVTRMYSWQPGALTCIFDHLGPNKVFEYKQANPSVPVIVRFMHPLNWQQDPATSARNWGKEVAGKWPALKALDPYVYFANEVNLHYENGDQDQGRQYLYENQAFYQKYADWVRMTADVIKQAAPDMKLVCPPFAFGHHEDGAPGDNGQPKEGWAGYDFLQDTIKQYFNNIITFHAYWGNAGGSNKKWLYDPEESSWYAFRWKRVLKLFEARYNIKARVIIDEAGNFATRDADFTDQIIYHANQCLSDGRVIALTYFLWSDPTNSPGNMLNSWELIPNLDQHVARLRAMPDVVITSNAPVVPAPVTPPVVTPPVELPAAGDVVMKIERGNGLPLIVGNWIKAGNSLELISPSGTTKTKTKSGSKLEFGEGGFEFYATEEGIYKLKVLDYLFEIPMSGQFTRLTFTQGEGQPQPRKRLVSILMNQDETIELLTKIEQACPEAKGVFEVQ